MRYNLIQLVVAMVMTVVMSGCAKRSINGDLDGQWQIMRIEYTDGSVATPERTYYCFFLHTINLRSVGGPSIAGNFTYKGDDIKIEFPNGNVENLKLYGINGTAVDFRIRTLTSSKMTLQSDYAIIDFRKF